MDSLPFRDVVLRAVEQLRKTALDDGSIGEYLLALLLLRYASDATSSARADLPTSLAVPEAARFSRLLERTTQPDNAKRVEDALSQLAKANPGRLAGQLRGRLSARKGGDDSSGMNRVLGEIIELFSRAESLSIEPILEFLADSSFGRGGEFHTPTPIVALRAEAICPAPGEAVYDPACGTGGFLLGALDSVRKRHPADTLSLFGEERSASAARIAAIGCLLHGIDERNVHNRDALRRPPHQRFDIVVSNPPYSELQRGSEREIQELFERFAKGLTPPGRLDYAYLLRMIECMKPETGRMGVIMPRGVLFRGGSEGEIRKKLIERNLLDAVVALPPKVFYGTAISTAMLFFRHGRTDDSVMIIDATADFEPVRKQNRLRDQDIEKIVNTLRSRKDVPEYARLVTRKEIESNQFNLSISRYFDYGMSSPPVNLQELSAREGVLRAELAEVQKRIDECLGEVGLSQQ
jgi:type I restriction enzyme M protein